MLHFTQKDHPPQRGPVAGSEAHSVALSRLLPAASRRKPLAVAAQASRLRSWLLLLLLSEMKRSLFCAVRPPLASLGRWRPPLGRRTERRAALAGQSCETQNATFLSENTLLSRQHLSMAPSLDSPLTVTAFPLQGFATSGWIFVET